MEKHNTEIIEIDLLELIQRILCKWWMFFLFGMLGGFAAFVGTTILQTPMYESKAMLYILSEKATTDTSYSDFQISNALTSDFEIIATSEPVIEGAIESLEKEYGVILTIEDVTKILEITNEDDTRILVVKARYSDPIIACILVNAVVEEISSQMTNIMQMDSPTIVERAKVAEKYSSPNIMKNVFIGILSGCLGVLIYIIYLFIKNDNIKTQEDIEKYLGLNTLAVMPLLKGKDNKKKELDTLKRSSKKKKKRTLE